ncbi:MAG TPA: hypothetical protein VM899_01230 [Rubellimicrobium sp.]|jgi:hypothetical protein|nr:hypothetical protein [Rubellimicrobium sp.]
MMFTTKTSSSSLFHVLTFLIDSHPATYFGRRRSSSAARRAEQLLGQMPAHLRDDIGLPPDPAPEPEHPAIARARNRASRWGS